MNNFKVMSNAIREREPIVRGRNPSPLSQKLLNEQTIFIIGPRQTFGNFYTLAKNHNMKARTHRTTINGEEGTLIWLETIE